MCGLVARVGPPATWNPGQMAQSLASLRHRGPDGEGQVTLEDGWVCLGHRRLAFVDRANGRQPLANEDRVIWAVVNGEIYDDERLRATLRSRGHRFRTGSDSEVLIHAYEEWGEEALRNLRGEHAFLLWDGRSKTLLAGRDRFGTKPLVWARHHEAIVLASEAKALFRLGVPPRWDASSFLHAVAHQYLPPTRTLFDGIRAVEPGTLLRVGREGTVTIRKLHRLVFAAAPEPNGRGSGSKGGAMAKAADEVRSILEEAVRLRLRGEAPVGAYLSGGIDSASVVAFAAKHAPRIRTFGVAFEHEAYDERARAEETAHALGVSFEPVWVRQRDLVEDLAEAVWWSEGLAINGQLSAKYRLAKAVRAAGVSAVLTGEGADEAFLGYPHLRQDYLGANFKRRPEDVVTEGIMLPKEGPTLPLATVQSMLGYIPSFMRAKAAFGRQLAELLEPEAQQALVGRYERLLSGLDGWPRPSSTSAARVTTSAWLWTRLALSGYIVRTLGDGTEMAASLEGRPPFLDHAVFEHAVSLPVELRIDAQGREKAVLREAMRNLLPEPVRNRPKHPFVAPSVLAHGRESQRARDLLESVIPSIPLACPSSVRRWLDEVLRSPPDQRVAAEPVWTVLTSAGLLGDLFSLAPPRLDAKGDHDEL